MALSLEQLRARAGWIGSSDVPAILGVDRYRNLGDLYLQKTGQIELAETTNDAADWGDRLEPIVCQWVSERVGSPWVAGMHRSSDDGILRAQLDGWMPDLEEPIESKTAGLLNPRFYAEAEGWGPEGTDEVPFRVLAQVQFALMLSGAARGHVGAFLGGGAGPRHYVIEAHADLQREIERRCRAFWAESVVARVPPAEVPHIDTLKSVFREPSKSVEIDGDLIERYRLIKDQVALVGAAADEAKAELIHALGDAEEGISPIGSVTYMANRNGTRALRVKETA
jgi:putative phage-type endonuclease